MISPEISGTSFRQKVPHQNQPDWGSKLVIITNNRNLELQQVLEVYAKRWHIENKINKLVSFFNLNALLSPLRPGIWLVRQAQRDAEMYRYLYLFASTGTTPHQPRNDDRNCRSLLVPHRKNN